MFKLLLIYGFLLIKKISLNIGNMRLVRPNVLINLIN